MATVASSDIDEGAMEADEAAIMVMAMAMAQEHLSMEPLGCLAFGPVACGAAPSDHHHNYYLLGISSESDKVKSPLICRPE